MSSPLSDSGSLWFVLRQTGRLLIHIWLATSLPEDMGRIHAITRGGDRAIASVIRQELAMFRI